MVCVLRTLQGDYTMPASKKKGKGRNKREKKEIFLQEMRDSANIAGSARVIGITRQTAYNWKKADPNFADAWDDVEQAYLDECVKVVFDEALGKGDGPPNADMAFRILARKRFKEWGQVDKHDSDKTVPVQIILGGNMMEGLK